MFDTLTGLADRAIAENIFDELRSLPSQWRGIEQTVVETRGRLRDVKALREDAELNAAINALIDGKNKEQRDLQAKSAIAADQGVQEMAATERELMTQLATQEIHAKTVSKQIHAALAMSELQAARLNLFAKYSNGRNGQ